MSEPAARLTLETPERVALSLDLAGVGTRALAYLLDLLIIFLFWMTVLLAYSMVGDLLKRWQGLSTAAQVIGVVLFFASGWLYDIAWELAWRGQTPGKRALGIRVVKADGSPVGFVESAVRNLLRAIEVPFAYAPGVLTVALTPRQQRVGDLLAGTLVVKDRAYDLSRYAALDAAPSPAAARAARSLAPGDFERLADFLGRRGELEPQARERIGQKIAAALAARAGLPAPALAEVEPFLESLAGAYGKEAA